MSLNLMLKLVDCGFKNVDCQTGKGEAYMGNATRTVSGVECQGWNMQEPHSHTYSRVGQHNHCRNPEGVEDGVWCFTSNSEKRREYCKVRTCKKCDKGKFQLLNLARISLR